MTFVSTISAKEEGPFPTFVEAFKNFWPRFQAFVRECPSLMALDCCWIQGTADNGVAVPLLWRDARDLGYDVGLLVGDGELQENVSEIDDERVDSAFLCAGIEYATWNLNRAATVMRESLATIR